MNKIFISNQENLNVHTLELFNCKINMEFLPKDQQYVTERVDDNNNKLRIAHLDAPFCTSRPSSFLTSRPRERDPVSLCEFGDLIYELSGKGVTTFVTTHYMDEAEYCNRIGLIYRGELIAIGSPTVHQHVTEPSKRQGLYVLLCRST